MTTKKRKKISVNKKTDRFFMAIAKKSVHSFLMVGIYDGTTVNQLLCRVGKWKKDGAPGGFFDVCCDHIESELVEEGIERFQASPTPINYQAFDITFNQYCELIRILESLQTANNHLPCFKPSVDPNELEDDEIEMTYRSSILFPDVAQVNEHLGVGQLAYGNTCRHTAIKLVEEIQKVPVTSSSSLVSRHFFKDLPYTTSLLYGKPCKETPFYVLPASPASYCQLDDEKKPILEKLYWRMEQMLLLAPDLESTQEKFTSLKELYLELLEGPELSLEHLLNGIQSWKSRYQECLTTQRRTGFGSFFNPSKTATMSLIDTIQKELIKKMN